MRTLLVFLFLSSSVRADTFSMSVYGYQKNPLANHVYAVFTRLRNDGVQEKVCISWAPAEKVRHLRGHPVRGQNWTEEQSRSHARSLGCRIDCYGPWSVNSDLWNRACKQYIKLQSGQVMYSFLDSGDRPGSINCISAVLEIGGGRPPTYFKYGTRAAGFVSDWLLRLR